MPINLHERLSEFSYGYGVTREVEGLIATRGLQVTPFLPNLVQEASLGFDVSFNVKGSLLLLQFKLGEELRKFRSTSNFPSAPQPLSRPFWRYKIDTSEDQFLNLLEWERQGASVFYASPRFSAWAMFDACFQSKTVLLSSLLVRPTEIEAALTRQQSSAGMHRILYDRQHRHVCSEPIPIEEVRPDELATQVEMQVREDDRTLSERLKVIRRSDRIRGRLGEARISEIRSRAKSEDDANAAILALEAWTRGAQVLFVTEAVAS